MKKSILSLVIASTIFTSSAFALAPNTDLALMPYPQEVKLLEGKVEINQDFSVFVKGYSSERIVKLSQRVIDRVQKQTGLLLKSPIAESAEEATLVIDVTDKAKFLVQSIESDESYQLRVKGDQVVLSSSRPLGSIRGIETFLQLITNDAKGSFVQSVEIEDYPRFPHRGALIDSSRHFISVDTILRQIDGLASSKINVLHWHLTDDQGWRIESIAYPLLQETSLGGQYYTVKEMKQVVAYAADRGVRIIPEINLPSHASQIVKAYPELGSGDPLTYKEGTAQWGVFLPLLDPTNPDVYRFVETIVAEIAAIFPDQTLHIGGDEPMYNEWKENEKIQTFMQENNIETEQALQAYFNAQVQKILTKNGKTMSGWDEIYHQDLPKSITIQSWRGRESLANAANSGFKGLLSTGWYIDQPQPTSYHYRNDPLPQALTVDDELHAGETFETFNWKKPRGKGSDRKGNLTIITAKDGTARAFSDYNGKPRAEVTITEYTPGKSFRGHFDNFMSYTDFVLTIDNGEINESLSYQVVGNVRWPTSGKQVAGSNMQGTAIPDAKRPFSLTKEQEKLILGGEMTLWAENVSYETLDVRLYPRAYAIGERLWSAKTLTDEDSMYQRMQKVSAWATTSVELKHHTDPYRMRVRLAGSTDVNALNVLADYTEPAQYYARNWIKYNNENYDQFDRLNRFVDTLAVESYKVYEMEKWVKLLAEGNSEASVQLIAEFERIQNNHQAAYQVIQSNHMMVDSANMAEQTLVMAELGIELLELQAEGKTLTQKQALALQEKISVAAQVHDEMVIAITRPVEQLVRLVSSQ